MSSKAESSAKKDGGAALVPKLRFPEFEDAAGWGSGKVDDLVDMVTPFKKLQTSDYRLDGSFPIIDQSPDFICGWTNDGEAVIDKILPVIVFGDHTCILKFVDRPFVQGADGIKIIRPKRAIEARFFFHALEAAPVKQEGYKRHFSILKEKKLAFPDFNTGEQQKIAECLNSADALVAVQGRKVEALKAHKKGLMQQLFPREGETQPRLRFPEFEASGEWEQAAVGDLVHTVTPPKKLQTADYQLAGEFPIIDQSQAYICGWTNDDEALLGKGLPVIIFGDHTCVLKFVNRPFAQGADGIKIIKPKRGIDTRFLFCALEANPVLQDGYKRHFSALKEKLVSFPDPKSGEQQHIADCLNSLDELIAAEIQKLDTLNSHKKGLMQQLFPRIGEDDL